jgi:hypothetical protein
MARDFKSSFIFPTQTATTGGAMGNTVNATQVFRTGLNTLSLTSATAASTAALTAVTSDFFMVDEMSADQTNINNVSNGNQGEGLYTAAAPLGIRITTATSSTAGLFTTSAAHGLFQGQTIVFSSVTGGGGVIRAFRPYVVQYISPTTFYLSERFSTVYLVTTTAVSASVLYATNPTFGLGPNSIPGQAGAFPEALPGQYVRPLYLRCVVQPNIQAGTGAAAVNVTNLTVTMTGSYVRGFNGTAGTIADFDATPYATVASKTFQQVFWSGETANLVPNTGAVFTMPFQTDFPFVRVQLSFGRTENTGALIGANSTIGVGLHIVTGRENALV